MIARLLRRRLDPDPALDHRLARVDEIMAQAKRDMAGVMEVHEWAVGARINDRAAELFEREAMQTIGEDCEAYELAAKTLRADAEVLRTKVRGATDGC